MPLYEYECERCGARFELIQRFSDPAIEACRTCGGPVHKLISAPAIQFKGTGWYITDYAKKSAPSESASSSSSTPTPSGSETKGETKSESAGTPSAPAAPSTDSKKE
jgi:putative FmdB family regulatory protein